LEVIPVIVGSQFPTHVAFEPDGLRLRWKRWRGEAKYIGSFVPWSLVRDADPGWAPPQLRLRDGRTLFIPATRKDELARALEAAGVSTVRRPDVWGHLLEPFVDTDYDIMKERWESDLRQWGLSGREVRAIRRRFSRRMLALTFLTWEWGGYGQDDLLLAWAWFRPTPCVASWWGYRRLRRWTDMIADRAPR
jgi:hypothetical protein